MEKVNYVGLSRRATRDLEKIWDFSSASWGDQMADSYFEAIEEALKRLAADASLLRAKPHISKHFQFYRVRKHFLICAHFPGSIFVLGIIHGSMDLPSRLSELEPLLNREAELLYKTWMRSQANDSKKSPHQ